MDERPRQEITEKLWNGNWDILFFAGHSHTEGQTGQIAINGTERLSLSELKYGLKKAIQGGLKLAIFNSCDGLGLAKELENLNIPQVIVMREPVPDHVAQDFLRYFLESFSRSHSIYLAVRMARGRIHDDGIESQIPGATWLPVICQNPATKPLVWPTPTNNRKLIFITSIVVTAILSSAVLTSLFPKTIVQDSPQKEQIGVYENSEYSLKLNYPPTWEKKERIWGSTIARFIPKAVENSIKNLEVNIEVNEYENKMTLDDFTREKVTEIRHLSGVQILENVTPTILANREARKLIYTETDGSTETQVLKIWTLKENTIYVVKYTAPTNLYDQLINDVDIIVNSFEVK